MSYRTCPRCGGIGTVMKRLRPHSGVYAFQCSACSWMQMVGGPPTPAQPPPPTTTTVTIIEPTPPNDGLTPR